MTSKAIGHGSLARKRKDLAVLWIEHDLELVLSEAARAIVLHHGELIHSGDPRIAQSRAELFDAYKNGGSANGLRAA